VENRGSDQGERFRTNQKDKKHMGLSLENKSKRKEASGEKRYRKKQKPEAGKLDRSAALLEKEKKKREKA